MDTQDFRIIKLLEVTRAKAEFLYLKLTPIICLMNFINKKVGNRKN